MTGSFVAWSLSRSGTAPVKHPSLLCSVLKVRLRVSLPRASAAVILLRALRLWSGVFCLALLSSPHVAHADFSDAAGSSEDREPAAAKAHRSPPVFSTVLKKEPKRRRGYILPQIGSFLLPGLDQWWEEQYQPGIIYSGTAFGGLVIASNAAQRLHDREISSETDLDSRDNDVRSLMLGSQLYMAAGSFSAYASFRSAVRSRQPYGEFSFLKTEERVDDLWKAPFEFGLIKKPTTWVPLAIVFGLMGVSLSQDEDLFVNNSFNASDVGFTGAFSYLAGTNEEALFRGWMMPVYMEAWGSPFWANTAQAVVFGAAHLSGSNPLPWPQLLLGWYLGDLSQRNGWTLKESIFIHAWWDVIAFAGSYLHEARDQTKEVWLTLPMVTTTF